MTTAPSRKSRSSSGTECFAMNCTNYQNGAKEREPIRHGQWAQNCRRNKPPGSNAKVCSAHFTEDQLDRTGQIVRLREGAIPTIFNLPCHLINVSKMAFLKICSSFISSRSLFRILFRVRWLFNF
uniref:THAP-type domain-containing protein n=1 Tax=Eptatretus burgeri TaxID=7764 RepID=A0A8C4QGW7_EPTBU